MAKRVNRTKRKAAKKDQPIVGTTRKSIVGFEDTGIYLRPVVEEEHGTLTADEFTAMLNKIADASGHLSQALDSVHKYLAEVVRPVVMPAPTKGTFLTDLGRGEGTSLTGLDLGDGRQAYSLPGHLPDRINEAVDGLHELHLLRTMMEGSDIIRIALSAYRLGRLAERVYARPYEPYILSQKRIKAAQPKAAKERSTKAGTRRNWAKEQFPALVVKHKNNRDRAAKELAELFAEQFDGCTVRPRTILEEWCPAKGNGRK